MSMGGVYGVRGMGNRLWGRDYGVRDIWGRSYVVRGTGKYCATIILYKNKNV